MPKVKISEYSATANSNTDVASINIDEGCAPSGINNAIRAVMGHLKDFQQGTNGDPFNGPVNGTLGATTASTANVTTLTTSSTVTHNGGTANGVAYLNGSKVLTTGSALVFDGTNFTAPRTQITTAGSPPAAGAGLEIIGGTSPLLFAYNRGTSAYLPLNATASAFGWGISGSDAMTLTSTGLGIGTSSPAGGANRVVDVYGSGSSAINFHNATSGTTATDGGVVGQYGSDLVLYNYEAGIIQFGTNNQERARIDYSGNLLVNTTSAVTTTVGSRLMYGATDPYISSTLTSSSDATTSYLLYSTGAGAYRFYVGLGGTIFATSIVISAISDQRLKENVRDIDTGLNSIMALKPRRFDWKEGKGQDKKNVAGFIAQEFEDVFPECVSTSKAGEDGIEYKNINHETLIPTLVKAIQELKAEFDAYKASHP